ncbi:MAG TPA: ATP-dependent acyl-CoA ligase [Chloroflexota bacterium]
MHIWQLLERQVERTPTRTLLSFQALRQSYAEVLTASLRAAAALDALGVRAGENVCLMLGNGPDYLYAWLGLARLGAVAVPINVHSRGEGLAYVLAHSQARLLIVEPELLGRVEALDPAPPGLRAIARAAGPEGEEPVGAPTFAELRAAAEPRAPAPSIPSEAVAAILYTSGTTGPPKGVMLSHHAYLSSARYFAEEMVKASADDTLYTTLPLFHINAQAHTALPAIHLGATMAIGARFSASGFWDDLRQQGATIFNSLAAMIPILCKQPPGPADRDHPARLTACAATPRDVWREFERRFGVRIVEGYGLTETAGFCVANPLEATRVGSIGRPMGFVEARVVDAQGRRLPPDQTGEIAIRARAEHVLMEGYYRDPEATARAMRPSGAADRAAEPDAAARDAGGDWFHSGDAGRADGDGYLYFVDRIKQSIRRRGENISSWEVEKVVNAHPAVLESAAVGYPSELGEEEVRVFVVAHPSARLDPLELIRWCEERMAYFMVPRYVDLCAALPKTATERVEKYRLKAEPRSAATWDRDEVGYRVRRD